MLYSRHFRGLSTFCREVTRIVRDYRTNGRIRAREVLVIGLDNEQLGVMPVPEAIRVARENGVDVVEVAPNTDPPVCRLMDYGKFRYDQAKKEREAKKAQRSSAMREVRMRTRIGDHDMQRKTGKIREFLAEGDKVKVSVQFRGREMTHPEIGNQLLGKVARSLMDSARVETPPVMERRMMSMVLVPGRRDGAQASAPEGTDAKTENA